MPTNNLHQPTPDDPLWDAFCYAAGELPSADAEAFEARLAIEQPLREQVARAVAILEAVRLVEEPAAVIGTSHAIALAPAPPRRNPAARRFSRLRRRLLWTLAASAAVCVAFFTGLRLSEMLRPNGSPAPGEIADVDRLLETPGAGQLVSLWAQSWAEPVPAVEPDATEQAFAALDAARRADVDPSVAIDEAGQEFVVPGWMLAAVSENRPATADDSPAEAPAPSEPN